MEHQQQHESSSEQTQGWRKWLWLAGCLAPLAAVAASWVFKVPLGIAAALLFLPPAGVKAVVQRANSH